MTKILIIEDDPLISHMYQKIFMVEGYEVDVAEDGVDGLRRAKKTLPTLILLDIMMPKMNGIEVLNELKRDPLTVKIPVIVLTNLSGIQNTDDSLKNNVAKYIVKSDHKPKEIVAMVKEVLANYTSQ